MARTAVEQLATGTTVAYASYDSTRWTLGSLVKQYTGAAATDKYIGPVNAPIARPADESPATNNTHLIDAVSWSSTVDWVFAIENVSVGGSTARRIHGYTFDRSVDTFTWKGYITFSFTNGFHTVKDLVMTYYTYSAGTVDVTTTSVTGNGTAWQTNRVAVGARIGFGTTDPTAVTTWYVISAIGSDTAITLTGGVPTPISAGTPYVIEELRPVIVTINSTAANGGVFVAKGVNWDDFVSGGTVIAASSSTTDNLKLTYWLADAGTVTNTVAAGAVAAGQKQTAGTSHTLYVLNGTTSDTVYKYNLRAADSISSGKMTLTSGTNIVITGAQAVTGTTGATGNLEIATAQHGPGSGVKSLYFVTTTRWYRADVNNIRAGNTLWISDCRNEVPPGGTVTYAATGAMGSIEYDSLSDRFAVLTTGASAVRSYYTNYPTASGNQFENIFLIDNRQLDKTAADSRSIRTTPYNHQSLQPWMKFVNGTGYLSRQAAANAADGMCSIYAVAPAAHWDYSWSTNQVAITPVICTPGASAFYRAYVVCAPNVGDGPFTAPTGGVNVWYRTGGIYDNSGAWSQLDETCSLAAVAAADCIQFRLEFQTIGNMWGAPARVFSVNVVYESPSGDSHYQPSAAMSNASNKRFAWRFSVGFGSTVPALRVRLYDAVTGRLLVDDNTASPTGTFEASTNDGGAWSAWTSADKGNDTTYLRYTPASLADGVGVRALLTQN